MSFRELRSLPTLGCLEHHGHAVRFSVVKAEGFRLCLQGQCELVLALGNPAARWGLQGGHRSVPLSSPPLLQCNSNSSEMFSSVTWLTSILPILLHCYCLHPTCCRVEKGTLLCQHCDAFGNRNNSCNRKNSRVCAPASPAPRKHETKLWSFLHATANQ